MRGRTARDRTARLERRRPALSGPGDRFSGYGVLGLTFSLGHVLALRRCVASSVGPPYTAVWHRSPEGRWTFYADVEAGRSCARYFASATDARVRAQIDLAWTGPATLAVSVPRHQIEWAVRVEELPVTRGLSAAARLTPLAALRNGWLPGGTASLAGWLLHARPLRLAGHTPAGYRFRLLPRRVWVVTASAAIIGGRDAGPLGPLHRPVGLGDLVMPARGLFGTGHIVCTPAGPDRGRVPARS